MTNVCDFLKRIADLHGEIESSVVDQMYEAAMAEAAKKKAYELIIAAQVAQADANEESARLSNQLANV